MLVPISKLLRPKHRIRVTDDESFRILALSILQHGIRNPIVVVRTPRHFRIIDGDIRFEIAKLLRFKEVPVKILDLDHPELERLRRNTHSCRA